MGKKNKQNWKRNLRLSQDKSFLNTARWFTPDDFEYNFAQKYAELCCDYLNKLRIEYITLRNNGEPKSSYKPEVAEKINRKKEARLQRKLIKADLFLKFTGMKLKDSFDPDVINNKPKFNYGMETEK